MIRFNIIDNLENIKEAEKIEEAKKYVNAAKKYAAEGLDEEMVSELLHIDGCSAEVSKNLAKAANSSIPSSYTREEPPETYADVKSKVEETIRRAATDSEYSQMIKEYFDKYADPRHKFLKDAILFAGLNESPSIFVLDLHKDMGPFVDGMIISNAAIANKKQTVASDEKREQLEYNLFGVWPAFLIQKHAHRKNVEKDILDKSLKDE